MKELHEFVLDDVLEKIKTKKLPFKAGDLPEESNELFSLPALTAGVANQGLSKFVPRHDATILKDVISVSANGANTGVMFFQSKEFTVLQDSYAIKWKGDFIPNKYQYLYIVTSLQKVIRGNFDWSNKASWERIKNYKFKLPVNDSNDIDWEYMNNYIKKIEQEYLKDLKNYINEF